MNRDELSRLGEKDFRTQQDRAKLERAAMGEGSVLGLAADLGFVKET
jgi:hypothetical protein